MKRLLPSLIACLVANAVLPAMAQDLPAVAPRAAVKARNDFNGDGRTDLLWRNANSGMVWETPMNGATVMPGGLVWTEANTHWQIAASADLDGDGKSDLVWVNDQTGMVYGMLMDGLAVKGGAVLHTEPNAAWSIIAVDDFSGTGKAGLLWRHAPSGMLYMMPMDGLTEQPGSVIWTEPDANWEILGTGDFNGDGKADILWRNKNTGMLYTLFLNGASVTGGQVLYTEPDTNWQIVAIADFNGDGTADLLWQHAVTGMVYVMPIVGATVQPGAVVWIEASAKWQIEGVGDYDGDGKADLLYRNQDTGALFQLLLNGTSVKSHAIIYQEPNTTWGLQVRGTRVQPAADLTVTVANQTVIDGQPATFTAVSNGTGLTYAWKRNGSAVGTNAATYGIGAANWGTDNGATFTVTVTDAANRTATSAPATLSVTAVAPSIITQPQPVTVAVGQTATFTVVASGSALTYQWYRNGSAIGGATANTYTTPATTAADQGATFKVTVGTQASAQTVTSGDATLTLTGLSSNPIILTQPSDTPTLVPDPTSLSVTAVPAVAGHTLTYQWYKGGSAISGATAATYTATGTTGYADAGSTATYYVVVKDGTASTQSNTVSVLTALPDPVYPGAGDPVLVAPTTRVQTVLSSAVVSTKFPKGCYRFGYEEAYKEPLWSTYCQYMRASNQATGSRNFSADTRLAAPQVNDGDFGTHGGDGFFLSGGGGFDRGHMVPIADLSYGYGAEAGTSTCKMSNMSAQVSYYNQRLWLDLENAVGAFTDSGGAFKRTWIYSGNVMADVEDPTAQVNYWLPGTEKYSTTRPTGSTLGIAIPVACYKIVVVDPDPGQTLPRVMAWVSANRVYQTAERADMWKYCTSVARIEQLTGLDFFPNFPHDASLAALKQNVDVRGWGTSFSKSSGPNVHIVNPSWDIKATGTGQGFEYVIQPYPKAGATLAFEAAASTSTTGFTSASWNFGDNTGTVPVTLSAVNGMAGDKRTHAFAAAGAYTVTFSATDAAGVTNTITRLVTVK